MVPRPRALRPKNCRRVMSWFSSFIENISASNSLSILGNRLVHVEHHIAHRRPCGVQAYIQVLWAGILAYRYEFFGGCLVGFVFLQMPRQALLQNRQLPLA